MDRPVSHPHANVDNIMNTSAVISVWQVLRREQGNHEEDKGAKGKVLPGDQGQHFTVESNPLRPFLRALNLTNILQ